MQVEFDIDIPGPAIKDPPGYKRGDKVELMEDHGLHMIVRSNHDGKPRYIMSAWVSRTPHEAQG